MANPGQQNGGPPPWVTAGDSVPPGVIASHDGAQPASLLSGTAEPPTSLLAELSSALATGVSAGATGLPAGFSTPSGATGPPAGFSIPPGATGPPPGFVLPSGVTGPPPGITPPPGVTGPPAGFSMPAGVTGPPAEFSIPSGVMGFPAGMTGLPSGFPGAGSGAIPEQIRNHALTREQSHTLIGVTCMLLALCAAAVGARLMARRVSRMRLESDDWSSVAALFMFIALCIEQFVLADYGLLILTEFPPPPNVQLVFGKAEFASQITYAFVTCATKISLLMLYRRVFSLRVKWFRIAWRTNIGLVAAMFVTLIVLNCTQCTPLSTIWNRPGSCLPSQAKASSLGFINALIDSAILVLPLHMVWSLQMSHKQKVAISGVFGLGLIGVAVSIARAITISSPRLFKGGGLAFIMWSTTEPAVALICSCLPVLRPLYTTGLKKLGSSRGWTWYTSKRSKSFDYPTGSSTRDKENSNMTGSTLRSPITAKTKNDKIWLKTSDVEMSGPYQEMHSPKLPIDKPLPPAYSPRQEEDTGYHTWSWNLLSRPRHEDKAPTLTRSPTARDSAASWKPLRSPETGVHTTVTGGKFMNKVTPIRLKTQVSTPDRSPNPRSQFDNWSSPPRTANTSISQPRSPLQSTQKAAETSVSASPSKPMRHVAKCDVRHQSVPGSPEGGFILPMKPRPVPRIESAERTTLPKLAIWTENSSPPPGPLPKFSGPLAYNDWNRGPRDSTVDLQPEEQASSEVRPISNVTIWPSAEPGITQEDVEAAISKGHAM